MSKLNLTIATGNYDRTRPISDGRVNIEGVDLESLILFSGGNVLSSVSIPVIRRMRAFVLSYCVGACNPDFRIPRCRSFCLALSGTPRFLHVTTLTLISRVT